MLAAVSGRVVPLEEVPDEVFAQGMAGSGAAIVPESSGEAVAPVSGVLVKLFEGGHAFGISTDGGMELIVHRNPEALQKMGAVLEGNRNVYWRLTPEENLEYFGVLKGLTAKQARQRGAILLERFGLETKRKAQVQNLSRGMQQKLAIAVALVHQPQLLLLDEPTLGLDVEATENVKVLVREIASVGCAILLTTHQLNIAELLSDRVAIIQKGEIVAESTTRDLIRQFSGNSYKIETEVLLDPERMAELETIGAEVKDRKTIYINEQELLYKVLEILKPIPLRRVEKDEADLTQIFLQLVRGSQNGNG